MSQNVSAAMFCPQNKPPKVAYLDKIRRYLCNNQTLAPFVQSILDLSDMWDIFAQTNDGIAAMQQGPRHLRNLSDWIAHGNATPLTETMSGIVALPLLTIIQIAQYFQYLECRQLSHSELLTEIRVGGVQGYCGGLFPVMAIATSKNEEELVRNAAVAVRIALGVGAYGELGDDDNIPGSTTVVLHLKQAGQADEIINEITGAYISAVTDPMTVSVVGPVHVLREVKSKAEAKGLTVTSLHLRGKVHNPENSDLCIELCKVCDKHASLTLPTSESLLLPVRSNKTGEVLSDVNLTHEVVESTLTSRCEWYSLMTAMSLELQKDRDREHTFMMFGVGRKSILPLSLFEEHQLNISKVDIVSYVEQHENKENTYPEHAIAVIGMACKFPEADSVSEFWDLLTAGTSTLRQVPSKRFNPENIQRDRNSDIKFWGNFIRDVDAFDHRFFKKSSREAASMDPQQRLLLEVAYQAMESSGYFRGDLAKQKMDIGCYVGVCSSDYNDNVASHPSNAFSSLGTLRAFLTGKISHYFGWTGPSITFDTACSSSAVAIHAACQAIQSGECSQAVAGGAAVFTSPYFYQNLATASFLSPTGACKPFDAKADGYCRGEGVGLVVLKKLSAALADGDNIIGVLGGTAVNQNYNSTYITVPHSQSQIELYRKVSSLAGIDPSDVTYVEAHGTGTPVGDPIEFESIRQVFGGGHRDLQLYVSSVKGNIGHLEGASGVAALIKTLLMIQHKTIPIQANFSTLNPKILATAPEKMAIPLATQPWNVQSPIACINNYGAAGSNAAMVVLTPPSAERNSADGQIYLPKYPIFIAANSPISLSAYCTALKKTLEGIPQSRGLLANVAFSLSRTQNHSLTNFLASTVGSLAELDDLLARGDNQCSAFTVSPPAKPVVLVFGGQTSNKIALNKSVYQASRLLRWQLDFCDSNMRSCGLPGLYPSIFQTKPIENVVHLHSMLFALQYSCARAFIDSGLHVDAVIGHSFGQLTALVVSGSLSFADGLKLISGRASLMQSLWGPERGSMLAIEADTDTVQRMISSVDESSTEVNLEIACYNGPTSHVIVGSEISITALQNVLLARSIKHKQLEVTHGFHSVFTEPLLPGLIKIAEGLTFHDPAIPLESCSNGSSWVRASPELIAEHTRTPVYFGQAVGRLEQQLGPCTWLEAGSASSVINLVRRNLSNDSMHVLQGIQLNTNESMSLLADATVNLWKAGHGVQFWPFHFREHQNYSMLQLPPYQFEKARHWLDWAEPSPAPTRLIEIEGPDKKPTLLRFCGLKGRDSQEAEFRIDPNSEEYDLYVSGHAVLANALFPAPLYVEIVSKAALTLTSNTTQTVRIPSVENLEIKAPLGRATGRQISLVLANINNKTDTWKFTFSSSANGDEQATDLQSHATGIVSLRVQDSLLEKEMSRFERLAGIENCHALKGDVESEGIQGAMIYKTFSKVVTYADYYMGVKSIHGKNNKVTADIRLPENPHDALAGTITEPLAVDNFIQVAGLHVNSLKECSDKEVRVCTQVDQILPSPKFNESRQLRAWTVYSTCSAANEQQVINDIFVFDSVRNQLVFIVLGAHFTKVQINSLTKILNRANNISHSVLPSTSVSVPTAPLLRTVNKSVTSKPEVTVQLGSNVDSSRQNIARQIRILLQRVADIPIDSLTDNDVTLEDLGVDSLMITEIMNEISSHFEVEISASDFSTTTTLNALEDYVISRGIGTTNGRPDIDSFSTTSPSSNSGGRDDLTSQTSFSNSGPDIDGVILKLTELVGGNLETKSPLTSKTDLANEGLDSLLWIELGNEIKDAFGSRVDVSQLNGNLTFGELVDLVVSQLSVAPNPRQMTPSSGEVSIPVSQLAPVKLQAKPAPLTNTQRAFESVLHDYDVYAKESGFSGFWSTVYPAQAKLVLAYTVEAFSELGCSLATLRSGDRLPDVQCLDKYSLELTQLYNILEDARLAVRDGNIWIRTEIPVDPTPSSVLHTDILQRFPQHASEHRLLSLTASKLAACLNGSTDPLHLLFRRKEDKELLEEVYTNGPMYAAITKLLGSFLKTAYSNLPDGYTINILELGGGTGGTTKYIVEFLIQQGIPFTYTFTDLSGSLVTAARKKFTFPNMEFLTLDIERTPPDRFSKHFHTIISTNCIHATSDLVKSCTHIRQMLRPDGFLSVVEFTRNIYWFDLVFGLLDGWWLFKDGRNHVLASEDFWNQSMRAAGFNNVSWTDGPSEESKTLRIITGFTAET